MGNNFLNFGEFLDDFKRRQFNILVSGPAFSGRTAFLLRNLRGKYVDPAISEEIKMMQFKRENCLLNFIDTNISLNTSKSCSQFVDKRNPPNSYLKERRKAIRNNLGKNETEIIEEQCKFDGILFFVDSSDHGRVPLARKLLIQLIEEIGCNGPVILIIAAKQDALGALNPKELAIELNIDEIIQFFGDKIPEIGVIGVSSYTGFGCKEALDWITDSIWRHQSFCLCIPFNNFCYNLYNCNLSFLSG
ncbi:hypothetical protein FG386_002936 [Cryptosporidium ryanae]|uniref:uncharacterized protein n=1 Tax=Cryptosporidium ryanae TaxID=515981 RepID=UPI00351A0603|nr:hypothetical protein FG386_002936 [Cryptosporidium ryanae]